MCGILIILLKLKEVVNLLMKMRISLIFSLMSLNVLGVLMGGFGKSSGGVLVMSLGLCKCVLSDYRHDFVIVVVNGVKRVSCL